MELATICQPVSLRRVSLLLVLGLVVGLSFTRCGAACLGRVAVALDGREACPVPAWAWLPPADGREAARWTGLLWKAFYGSGDDEFPATEGATPPMADFVEERLAGLDGWETAVLYRDDASPADLLAAGLSDREECLRVMQRGWVRILGAPRSDPVVRSWSLVMLDGHGRELGRTLLSERLRGWVLAGCEDGTPIYRRQERAGDDAEGPRAAAFRRSAQGVRRGA